MHESVTVMILEKLLKLALTTTLHLPRLELRCLVSLATRGIATYILFDQHAQALDRLLALEQSHYV